MPEYIRIKRALRECITAHTDSMKLLERCVQAIYSMKNMSQLLATDKGEEEVLDCISYIRDETNPKKKGPNHSGSQKAQ